jgi:hypothetical protein
MITLNQTIGGNLEIALDKGAKKELKEILSKATNTDAILSELLDISGYLGNDWHEALGVLTEAPIIAYGAIYEDENIIDYDKVWYYPNYMTTSFAEVLLKDKRVIFKKH